MALTGLRLIAIAIDSGDDERADAMIGGMLPEPFDGRPSLGQMIAVALEHLDTWFGDKERAEALASVVVPRGSKVARTAAADLLALAAKGRAFDSMGSLLKRYGDPVLMQGAALAVTGTLQAWAAFDESTVRAVGVGALG